MTFAPPRSDRIHESQADRLRGQSRPRPRGSGPEGARCRVLRDVDLAGCSRSRSPPTRCGSSRTAYCRATREFSVAHTSTGPSSCAATTRRPRIGLPVLGQVCVEVLCGRCRLPPSRGVRDRTVFMTAEPDIRTGRTADTTSICSKVPYGCRRDDFSRSPGVSGFELPWWWLTLSW